MPMVMSIRFSENVRRPNIAHWLRSGTTVVGDDDSGGGDDCIWIQNIQAIHSFKMFPINRIQKSQQQTAVSHSMHVVYVCVCAHLIVWNNNRFLLFVPSKSFEFPKQNCRCPKLDGCLACIHHFAIGRSDYMHFATYCQLDNEFRTFMAAWLLYRMCVCGCECMCETRASSEYLNFAENCNKCLTD